MLKEICGGGRFAVAVDTDDGLFVPALRNCENMNAQDARKAINRIREQVKTRSIPPEELRDFTIVLSNFGVFAGKYATPVVTPPCVCIVGAGRLFHELVPVLGGVETHRIMPISLTFDHRACTGGEAALDSFDLLAPLVEWVEKGTPPSATATGRVFPGRSRPLCAYPQHAHYKGQGDTQTAENFDCRN